MDFICRSSAKCLEFINPSAFHSLIRRSCSLYRSHWSSCMIYRPNIFHPESVFRFTTRFHCIPSNELVLPTEWKSKQVFFSAWMLGITSALAVGNYRARYVGLSVLPLINSCFRWRITDNRIKLVAICSLRKYFLYDWRQSHSWAVLMYIGVVRLLTYAISF